LDELNDYVRNNVDYNEQYAMKIVDEGRENLYIEHKLEKLSEAHFKILYPIIDNFNTLSKGLVFKLKKDYIGQDDLDCMLEIPGTTEEFTRNCNITLYYDLWSDGFIKKLTRSANIVMPG
jgi:hypothetical protein